MKIESAVISSILAILILIIAGCSDSGDDITGPVISDVIAPYPAKAVYPHDPMAQCGNYYAGQAAQHLSVATDCLKFFDAPEFPDRITSLNNPQDTITRIWQIESLTVTLRLNLTIDGYQWDVYLTGTDNGITYDDWKYIYALQTHADSSGMMFLYENNETKDTTTWDWTSNITGNIEMNMSWNDNDFQNNLETLFRPDYSGYARHSINDSLRWEVTWDNSNSESSGEWTDYMGESTLSGTWSY